MKTYLFLLIFLMFFIACKNNTVIYELYSNGQKIFEIQPNDIEFYDTTQERNGFGIVEMRLKNNFYKVDSFVLKRPIYLFCKINNKRYFWADLYHRAQATPRLWINFNFRSLCFNGWSFPNQDRFSVILNTKNLCNSIEFFHKKDEIKNNLDYYLSRESFLNYTDTARLAHEILFDPYYINALKESGVKIK